jgi:hypothetical protein
MEEPIKRWSVCKIKTRLEMFNSYKKYTRVFAGILCNLIFGMFLAVPNSFDEEVDNFKYNFK